MKDYSAMLKDNLKILEGINRVEVPVNMYAAIQQKIEKERKNNVSMKTVYTMAASFLIFFSINIYVGSHYKISKKEAISTESYDLGTNNKLYNE